MATRKNVTAATVRTWGRENIDTLPEEARKCLGETARGRLHPALVEAYKKANKRFTYEPGVAETPTVEVTYKTKDKRGRNITKKVTITTAEARALLGEAKGKRGRLNMGALSEAYAAKVAAEA